MILITIYSNRSIAIKEKEMIMKYRKDRYGNEISALGFGCMRFTGKLGRTDKEKAEKEIMAALEAGVNYFDTAYLYPGSEALIGEVFEKNGVRDKIKIATKLPHYMVKKYEDYDKFFNEQLKRLRTDHVEYYLMHMINDADSWRRLVNLGIESWIEEKKAAGKLQQIGFSYHGNADAFKELIDAYDWDFCQIQYNYLDETSQAGRTGFEYAVSKGIPVVIMEPLRGGKLAVKLPKQAMQKFDAYNKQHNTRMTPAAWGLSWLWDQPGVTCVLSGMNSLDMIIDNVRTAGKAEPECFGEEEKQLIADVKEIIESKTKVPCTGCRYCMPCPKGVDIPGIFSAYNNRYIDGWFTAEKEYVMCTTMRRNNSAAHNCIGCGACEQHCPQHIEIRNELKAARKKLEGIPYKVAKKVMPIVYKY